MASSLSCRVRVSSLTVSICPSTRRCRTCFAFHDASVMKQALQNHTPQTIVVDEVSDKLEARACLDIKARYDAVFVSFYFSAYFCSLFALAWPPVME